MGEVVERSNKPVARPLNVLVPLIKQDLADAEEATKRAGLPYYRAAGEKMLEAKSQMKHGEFGAWIKRNFNIGRQHAARYMQLAQVKSREYETFDNFSDFMRKQGGDPGYGKVVRQQPWHDPVKEIINKVDVDTLNLRRAELTKLDERKAERDLAIKLIDIGYKTLATKLHPDKGGSRDAMARLNRVRDRLRQHI